MSIKKLIMSRYSVRSYIDKDVPLELIKDILKTANSAPSGGNIQPWKIYIVTNNAKKKLTSQALSNFDNGVQEEIDYEI